MNKANIPSEVLESLQEMEVSDDEIEVSTPGEIMETHLSYEGFHGYASTFAYVYDEIQKFLSKEDPSVFSVFKETYNEYLDEDTKEDLVNMDGEDIFALFCDYEGLGDGADFYNHWESMKDG